MWLYFVFEMLIEYLYLVFTNFLILYFLKCYVFSDYSQINYMIVSVDSWFSPNSFLTAFETLRFFETLTKIKDRDPVIKDPKKNFFDDEDFKKDKKSKKEAAVRYRAWDYSRESLDREFVWGWFPQLLTEANEIMNWINTFSNT